MSRLRSGEGIAGIAAVLLFVFMFFDWFGTKTVYETNLLYAIARLGPEKMSAWEALDFTPLFLMLAIITSLAATALRVFDGPRRVLALTDALVAILGAVSVVLIFGRIVNPPVFSYIDSVRFEGAVRYPVFLALISAAGVAVGGLLALREGGVFPSGLRSGQQRDQAHIA